jgi:hypothetical protein
VQRRPIHELAKYGHARRIFAKHDLFQPWKVGPEGVGANAELDVNVCKLERPDERAEVGACLECLS